MKLILYLAVLTFSITATDSSIYNNIKQDLLTFLKRSFGPTNQRYDIQTNNAKGPKPDLYNKVMKLKEKTKKEYGGKPQPEKEIEVREPSIKEPILKKRYDIKIDDTKKIDQQLYQLDPILNFIERRHNNRRKYSDDSTKESSTSDSSSLELQDWKDEWKYHWMKKKFEAVNSTEPTGDAVNMVAARPWGVPCGDPNQHDMPWGTCMLAMECDAEYRIYRGDYFCGRTQFICCALQFTNYDMNQGFDVSFASSGLSTDSEEKRNRGKGSKEKRRRKKKKEKKKRKKDRLKRKRKIKKNIKKIVKEIRKILNRAYRNGTSKRKRKTKELKKFIKELKKRYKKDRQSVKDIHEVAMIKIDATLQKKLDEIKDVNRNFMKNSTFRDIIINGTTNKQGARMLVEAYPDLQPYFDNTRRTGDEKVDLDYDIEYGMLYY